MKLNNDKTKQSKKLTKQIRNAYGSNNFHYVHFQTVLLKHFFSNLIEIIREKINKSF